jgi:intracellular multiplication protein IcmV
VGFWKKTKNLVGHVIDFRVDRWVDLDYLKKSSSYYAQETKRLFTLKKADHTEEFEEAAGRLSLSTEDLSQQAKRYAYMAVLFLAIGLLFFLYAIFLAVGKNWMSAIISCSLMIYALALAFRSHFWHFQISQKKLGCTASEWFRSLATNKRNPS